MPKFGLLRLTNLKKGLFHWVKKFFNLDQNRQGVSPVQVECRVKKFLLGLHRKKS